MKRPNPILMIVFAAVVLGAAGYLVLRPKEPSHQGRKWSAWLADLTSLKPELREPAKQAFVQMGTNGFGPLLLLLQAREQEDLEESPAFASLRDESVEVLRMRGVQALRALGPAAAPVIPDLVALLADHEAGPRAITALSGLGPAAIPVLINALAGGPLEQRINAARTLGRCGAQAEPAVPALVRGLEAPEPKIRMESAQSLRQIRQPAETIIPALLTLLKDEDPEVLVGAAAALGDFGDQAKAAVPTLLEAIKNPKLNTSELITALHAIDPAAVKKAKLKLPDHP